MSTDIHLHLSYDATYRGSRITQQGSNIVNAQNGDLGKAEASCWTLGTGRIAYAVISFEGVLAVGDKCFHVPWNALHFNGGKTAP
jgi:hypothetical protein